MLAFLGSIFSGGLTGLLGVGLQRFFDFMKIKQELELKKLEYAQAHWLSAGMVAFSFVVLLSLSLLSRRSSRILP